MLTFLSNVEVLFWKINLGCTFFLELGSKNLEVRIKEDNHVNSHKREKVSNYSLTLKFMAISVAEVHGNRALEREFNVTHFLL